MDYEFVPGRDDFPPDEIAMLRRQLAAALVACEAKDDCLLDCAGNINPERGPFSRDHNNGLQHAIDIIRELKERK